MTTLYPIFPAEIIYDVLGRVLPTWRWGSRWKERDELKIARDDLAWFLSLRLVNKFFDDFVMTQFHAAIREGQIDWEMPIRYGSPTASTMAMGRTLLLRLVQRTEESAYVTKMIKLGTAGACAWFASRRNGKDAEDMLNTYSGALMTIYTAFLGKDLLFALLGDPTVHRQDIFDLRDVGEEDWKSAALMAAAYFGFIDDMQDLISLGVDVNHQSVEKRIYSPLVAAALNGQEEAVRFLIDRGADPHVVVLGNGGNAIQFAALGGHASLVRFLVDLGVDFDLSDHERETALYWAAGAGHAHVVRILVAKGAETGHLGRWDCTPLICASAKGYDDVVRELLKSKDVDVSVRIGEPDEFEQTALDVAAMMGRKQIVETLLSHPNVRGHGVMALRHTLIRGLVTDVERILEADPKILDRYREEYYETALHTAAEAGTTEMVRFLLDRDDFAIIDDQDVNGDTALDRAIETGNFETVRAILHAAELNEHIRSNSGNTHMFYSLTFAVNTKPLAPGIFEALLGHSFIRADYPNSVGETPLATATAQGRLDWVNLLLARTDVDKSTVDRAGNTILHHAVRSGNKELVARLLEALDIDTLRKRNREGETAVKGPLYAIQLLALVLHSPDCVRELHGLKGSQSIRPDLLGQSHWSRPSIIYNTISTSRIAVASQPVC
ncbi:ankyrin repeat-containing domain protein [Aspergillus pseudoustus]|uniref:Ankyrin repeat-containing domain protein n=1 Tax=Aspergillus pseudoustus TaxID=1810923 RepID=A0ABR4KY63_9EURO